MSKIDPRRACEHDCESFEMRGGRRALERREETDGVEFDKWTLFFLGQVCASSVAELYRVTSRVTFWIKITGDPVLANGGRLPRLVSMVIN